MVFNEGEESIHRAGEREFFYRHSELDGIEVFLTGETSSEVRAWVDSGVHLRARRALEPKESFSVFMWKVQQGY